MYYVVSIDYVGPNPEQHLNESCIIIQNRPERGNSDGHPEIVEGWCGTTNDWSVGAHGAFETIEAAREKVAEVASDLGYREDESDHPEDSEFGIFERYLFGTRPYWTPEESCGFAQPMCDDLTPDTADIEIEAMADEAVQLGRQEVGANLDGEAIRRMLVDFRDDLAAMASEE